VTLLKRFLLLSFATMAAFGIVLGAALVHFLEKNHIQRAVEITAEAARTEAAVELSPGDFAAPAEGAAYEALAEKVRHMSLGPRTVRVKLWNPEGVLVWSDSRPLVGRSAGDNAELARALAGETVASPTSTEKKENAEEGLAGPLLELYVPVRFGGEASPVAGVLAVYTDLAPLLEDIAAQRKLLWAVNAGGVLLLFLTLYGLVARASRHIAEQNARIRESKERLKNLLLFAHDAIVSMDRERRILLFNRSAEGLFGRTAEQAMGTPFDRLLSPRHRTDVISIIDRLYGAEGNDRGLSVQVDALRADGSAVLVDLALSASGTGADRVVTAFLRSEEKEEEGA
jgi:PAS domain S-box-containing protein